MSNHPIAHIQWLRPSEGGRPQPPAGPIYTTVARFGGHENRWTENAWSLVVEFMAPPDENLRHLAKVRFLSDNGPADWLGEGATFELMEGPKTVARGTVTRIPRM